MDGIKRSKEQEAINLAKKIKRCLNSTPEEFRVIITNTSVSVCWEDEFQKYFEQNGDIDNPPTISTEMISSNTITGLDCQL